MSIHSHAADLAMGKHARGRLLSPLQALYSHSGRLELDRDH